MTGFVLSRYIGVVGGYALERLYPLPLTYLWRCRVTKQEAVRVQKLFRYTQAKLRSARSVSEQYPQAGLAVHDVVHDLAAIGCALANLLAMAGKEVGDA